MKGRVERSGKSSSFLVISKIFVQGPLFSTVMSFHQKLWEKVKHFYMSEQSHLRGAFFKGCIFFASKRCIFFTSTIKEDVPEADATADGV
jgi:hypothetical protein